MNAAHIKTPSLLQSFFPILALILLLILNVHFFGDATTSGANQIALLIAAGIASVIAMRLGYKWMYIRGKIVESISSAMPAMLILLLIGSLAGTWLISGVVPTMIYYGLQMLNPTIFLVVAVLVTSIVSLATGSSWSTVATVGIALQGIGTELGLNEGLVAGSIISGAYFGDKISPLSDTTNLAPAMAGTTLFTHIYYMLYTTTPTYILTLIIFLFFGLNHGSSIGHVDIQPVLNSIDEHFFIHPILMLVPVIFIFIIIKKVAPLPSLMYGTLLGALFAIIFQPEIIHSVSQISSNYASESYVASLRAMFGEISIQTSNEKVTSLLTTRGMAGMLNTIWLIISAMVFGGVLEASGMLRKMAEMIVKGAQSAGSLVASTVGTCIFMNVTASDQYIAIVVPGRMYANIYKRRGYKPELLSRTLEDAGTVTSVLIPWNTCGATQSTVLGVPTMVYAPYAFFNIISPLMSIFMASFNLKIRRYTETEMAEFEKEEFGENKGVSK